MQDTNGDTAESDDVTEPLQVDFEVKLVEEEKEESTEVSTDAEEGSPLLVLKKSHFNLLFRANGKAELYFHCYFWATYIDSVATVSGQQGSELLEIAEI